MILTTLSETFFGVVGNGDAEVAVLIHLNGHIDRLKQVVAVDAGQNEAALIQSFGALGGRADADRRERMPHTGEDDDL